MGSEDINKAIQDLIAHGLTTTLADPGAAARRQQASLSRLLAIRSIDASQRFTTIYDSMMRLAEIALAEYGVEFGSQPHRAFKNLATGLDKDFVIDGLVSLRHRVKKTSLIPTNDQIEALLAARAHLSNLLGLSHLLD